MTSEQTATDVEGATGSGAPAATGVVVGIDGSASARAAVAWAAVAAERRGVGLHLVEVLPSSGGDGADTATQPAASQGRARLLLSRAQGVARSVSPALEVSVHVVVGRVAPALVDFAADASLLVVGSNGPGGPIPLSLGSIVGGVTRRCACPVVLVPASTTGSGTDERPVLVALEDTPDGDRALAFAAEAADRRGVALAPLVGTAGEGAPDAAESPQLSRLVERYPTLAVRPQPITERAAEALLHAGTNAQLIVVPSSGRGSGRSASTAGWTGHFLPVLSACPVAVVSTGTRTSTTLA